MSTHEASVGAAMTYIARGGTANLVGSAVSAAANFALVVLVAQLYDPTVAGALFATTSVFLIVVAAVEAGVDQGFVRYIATYLARGEGSRVEAVLRAGYLPVLALGVAATAAGLLLAQPLASLITDGGDGDPAGMLRVLAVAAPVAATYEVTLSVARGFSSMRSTVLVERLVRPVLQLVLVAACGLAHAGPATLAAAWAAPYLLGLVAAAAGLRRFRHRLAARGTADPSSPAGTGVGDFWRFTGPRGVARVAQVALLRIDVVIVAALLGPSTAAVYAAATRFLVVGQVAVQAVQQVIQPRLAHLLAVGDHEVTKQVFKRSTAWFVALTWPIYLLCAVEAALLLQVFGTEYVAGASSLSLLCVAMLAATAAGPVDVLLTMAGRSVLSLVNTVVALALDVTLCFLLIPHLGIFGAAVAWAVSIVARNALGLRQVATHLGVHAGSRPLILVATAAAVTLGLLPAAVRLTAPGWPPAVAAAAVGSAVYLALLWRWRRLLGLEAFAGLLRRRRPA